VSADRLRVALATCRAVPALSEDDQHLVAALRAQGAVSEAVVWDDPSVDWNAFDRVVIRSCWDYHVQARRFLDWVGRCEATGVALWNPPATIRGNVHKSYLERLARAGARVTPTRVLASGMAVRLGDVLAAEGWRRAVVKPAISASAFGTFAVEATTAAAHQRELDDLLVHGDVLVQPFVDEVVDQGEWSLIFFAGGYSHAVLKRARTGDFRIQTEFGGSALAAEPPARLLSDAEQLLLPLSDPWLYARVDGVEAGGRLLLMELELIEPMLFFAGQPAAAARFACAILRPPARALARSGAEDNGGYLGPVAP
jgi:hypothetical protein